MAICPGTIPLVLLALSLSTGGRAPAPDRARSTSCADAAIQGPAKTPEERAGELASELDRALAAFDTLLLHERNALAERQSLEGAGAGSRSGAGSEAGGGGARTGGERGGSEAGERAGQGGRAGGSASGGGEARPASGGSTASPAGTAEAGDPAGPAPDGGGGTTAARPAVPADVGDGRDDDIVARQIREAAMAEADPALRERLWQEYRDYKSSTHGGGGSPANAGR